MPQKALKHAYRHFADLQLSSDECYSKLEKIISSYDYPDIKVERRAVFESRNVLQDKREYLVIRRKQLWFYVCAAPYGRSYFVSWWFWHKRNWLLDWIYRSPIMSYLFEDTEATMYAQDTRIMFERSIDALIGEVTATLDPIHAKRQTVALN
ncbi:hypothetical protein [Mucilaginibacter sp.]|uniref:hypothetical protein n=1 Tax=Mucilaginibacter sp. TaxID=1882438 RepID=UPI003264B3D9